MVDVGEKNVTKRVAIASSQITMSEKAFESLMQDASPKGNVFETAKIAGIMAAKATPRLIPMCHPLELNKVNVTFEVDEKALRITSRAEVSCNGRTGVEMEALTAASVTALTIYDMMKWVDKSMVISDVKLLEKSGGKSGDYKRS